MYKIYKKYKIYNNYKNYKNTKIQILIIKLIHNTKEIWFFFIFDFLNVFEQIKVFEKTFTTRQGGGVGLKTHGSM